MEVWRGKKLSAHDNWLFTPTRLDKVTGVRVGWHSSRNQLYTTGSRPRADDNHRFLNAVLWIARTGAPWEDLPERFGKHDTVSQCFNRWAKKGRWQTIFEALQEPDLNRAGQLYRARLLDREGSPLRRWPEGSWR
jgi:transposase